MASLLTIWDSNKKYLLYLLYVVVKLKKDNGCGSRLYDHNDDQLAHL
jgi:hypothetical protein